LNEAPVGCAALYEATAGGSVVDEAAAGGAGVDVEAVLPVLKLFQELTLPWRDSSQFFMYSSSAFLASSLWKRTKG
jgi:hypothetical protein